MRESRGIADQKTESLKTVFVAAAFTIGGSQGGSLLCAYEEHR